jgi:hypothetical protein
MAFKLKSASRFTKSLTVEYAGETLAFDYKPEATSFEEKLKIAEERRELVHTLADAARQQAHFETRYQNELARLESGAVTDADEIHKITVAAKDYREVAASWRKRCEELNREAETLDVLEVCRLVVRWDALDENDTLIPTDQPKRVAELPAKLLELILEAIDKDAKPDPLKEPNSSSTSSPGASAATAPTGS